MPEPARADAGQLALEAVSAFLDKLSRQAGKSICHFRRVSRRAILEFVEVIPAEDAAVRPLTFPGSLLKHSCLSVFA
ncbi:MAG: hypothetical protein ABSG68_23245 [Thermoguttaceae bacterium]